MRRVCRTYPGLGLLRARRRGKRRTIHDEFFGDLTLDTGRVGADRAQNPGQGSYTVAGSAGWGGGGGQREPRGRRARPFDPSPSPSPARELRDLGGGWFGDDGRDAGIGSGADARSGGDAGGAGELDWDLERTLGGDGARCAALRGTMRLAT